MENLPCCFYIAEGKEPYRLLYANEQTIRLLDCRDLEDLYRHTAGMAFHFIAMDDRARIKQDILHALAKTPEGFNHARGHLFTRTSRIRYADVSGRRVQTEAYGPVYYCTIQEIDIPRPGVVVDRDIRDRVIAHLDEAIEKHWIQVYYQPVIRTMTGELCGMEALARWIDPEIGFLSPGSFIPVLEQVRLIHRLDGFVFEEVCRMLRQRLDENLPITPVSFNLSRYDFDMMDVFAFIENTRRKYAVPRDFLHVEITESVLAQDSHVIQQALTHLRQEGYEIWLDDFGSVYSSLNILKDYTVDLIKLDMGFCATSPRSRAASSARSSPWPRISALRHSPRAWRHRNTPTSSLRLAADASRASSTASHARWRGRSHISGKSGAASSNASGAITMTSRVWSSARRTGRVHSSMRWRAATSASSTPTGLTASNSRRSATDCRMLKKISASRENRGL